MKAKNNETNKDHQKEKSNTYEKTVNALSKYTLKNIYLKNKDDKLYDLMNFSKHSLPQNVGQKIRTNPYIKGEKFGLPTLAYKDDKIGCPKEPKRKLLSNENTHNTVFGGEESKNQGKIIDDCGFGRKKHIPCKSTMKKLMAYDCTPIGYDILTPKPNKIDYENSIKKNFVPEEIYPKSISDIHIK